MVASLNDDDFISLSRAVNERRCRTEVGFGTFAEAAALFRPAPRCPSCGEPAPFKDGWSESELQRYRCPGCGLRFNSLTGTILEYCKKDLATWVEFIRLMRHNAPIEAAAEICRITHQTAFEWRHRVFATVNGYQDRLVLRERIWIDETYINDTDLSHGYGEARKRGLSKQKLCIAVAIDIFKNPVAVVCGHGKPSSKRIKDGLAAHIVPGSVIVHDMEKSHRSLIKAACCADESYRADTSDPTYLECMAMVNNLCSWIKRYLWRFTGMDPANLQSYLNWYVYLFRVNQAGDKWPETERVVRHLLRTDASFRSSR
jgi:transposase-like protein